MSGGGGLIARASELVRHQAGERTSSGSGTGPTSQPTHTTRTSPRHVHTTLSHGTSKRHVHTARPHDTSTHTSTRRVHTTRPHDTPTGHNTSTRHDTHVVESRRVGLGRDGAREHTLAEAGDEERQPLALVALHPRVNADLMTETVCVRVCACVRVCVRACVCLSVCV